MQTILEDEFAIFADCYDYDRRFDIYTLFETWKKFKKYKIIKKNE